LRVKGGLLTMADYWNLLMHGGMGSMMWMGLFWIILLIVIGYYIVKYLTDRTSDREGKETPLEILKKELAQGNIKEEEYLKRKKHLD